MGFNKNDHCYQQNTDTQIPKTLKMFYKTKTSPPKNWSELTSSLKVMHTYTPACSHTTKVY